jgi:transcriptional regulator with XRE-family HTH domain
METKDKGDNTAAKAVGKELEKLRIDRGITIKEVCEKAGIKGATYTAIKNGYYNFGIRQAAQVAEALDAHIEIVKNEH